MRIKLDLNNIKNYNLENVRKKLTKELGEQECRQRVLTITNHHQ